MFLKSFGVQALVAAALVATPTVSGAQACQGARCVLPLPAPAAPLPPVVSTPAPSVPIEAVAVEPVRRGLGLLPILLGVAALAALIYLLASSGDDDDEAPASP